MILTCKRDTRVQTVVAQHLRFACFLCFLKVQTINSGKEVNFISDEAAKNVNDMYKASEKEDCQMHLDALIHHFANCK